jgi:phosphate transport system permease protein
MAGIYLAEYDARAGWAHTRFVNDILLSAPSIVIGLFIYAVVVARFKHFSGWAGALALALIVMPVVIRTTENMLMLVPAGLREAAYALGAPKWKVILGITLRAARAGVVTGVLLAVARISGETAPLLFTALNNQFWTSRPVRADGQPAGHHLQVRHEPVRELAAARLGRRLPHHHGRARA